MPGVGYPNPNRSHFQSMAIWQTARLDPEEQNGPGWIGRSLDEQIGTAARPAGTPPSLSAKTCHRPPCAAGDPPQQPWNGSRTSPCPRTRPDRCYATPTGQADRPR